MAKLKEIWIERDLAGISEKEAIRIEWDNDRHQRIKVYGSRPIDLIHAFQQAVMVLENELAEGHLGE